MRRWVAVIAVLLVSCGGTPGGVQLGATSAPAIWPLRGTTSSDSSAIHKRPIVVKVANDPAARPQSGISQADLVLEIPVEGGITRYALVFHSQEPGRIGPVRSARQSDLNYLSTFKAILVHVGASEQVTKMVRDAANGGQFVDVDEFRNADAFERVAGKVAPYNAYTTGSRIREAAGKAGTERVDVPALQFDASIGNATSVAGTSLVVPYTGAGRVSYEFDSGSGTYRRVQGGKPTVDDDAKREVQPDNVVVIKTDVKEIPGTADVTGAPSVDFRATGGGTVVVLREGKRFDGKWSRQANEMYHFADAHGTAIPLKPGLTWIHIVPEEFDVTG